MVMCRPAHYNWVADAQQCSPTIDWAPGEYHGNVTVTTGATDLADQVL